MEWSLNVDDKLGAIVITVRGPWEIGVVLEALEAMWSGQVEHGIHRVLWDCRELTAGHMPSMEVRQVANRQLGDRPELPPARAAFVASRDLEFGLGRMMEAFLAEAPVKFRAFKTIEEAADWLSGSF